MSAKQVNGKFVISQRKRKNSEIFFREIYPSSSTNLSSPAHLSEYADTLFAVFLVEIKAAMV